MTRTLVAVLTGCLIGCLSGCGASADVARNPEAAPSPSPSPSSAPPTTGTYPDYPHADYTYVLRLTCFCADAKVPFKVTVRDGKVVEVVNARTGAPGAKWMRVTLADIVAAANDVEAAEVTVRWPDGQAYPTSVYVDRDRMMADEEIGYGVSHVVATDGS